MRADVAPTRKAQKIFSHFVRLTEKQQAATR